MWSTLRRRCIILHIMRSKSLGGNSKEAEIQLKETSEVFLKKEDKEESKEEQLWQNFVQNVAMS